MATTCAYMAGVDIERLDTTGKGGQLTVITRSYLSVGHDEYWSGIQRANVEAARAAGVNLAFLSGNEIFWKTRWEQAPTRSATPYRTLVCYKETIDQIVLDPLDPPIWTGSWRDPSFSPPADGGRPENALTGTIFMVDSWRSDTHSDSCPHDAVALLAQHQCSGGKIWQRIARKKSSGLRVG